MNYLSLTFTGDGRHERLRDEDDELLQFAIQQSLMEAGTENDQVSEDDHVIMGLISVRREL